MYQIEKGVPLPAPRKKREEGLTATMRNMEVGDSILVPQSRRSNVYMVQKALGHKYTVRQVDKSQVRIWRIE